MRHPELDLRAALLQDLPRVLVDAHEESIIVRDRVGVVEVAPVGARERARVPGAGAAAEDPGRAVPRARDRRDLADRCRRRRGEVRSAWPVADARGGFGPDRRVFLDDVARQAALLGAG